MLTCLVGNGELSRDVHNAPELSTSWKAFNMKSGSSRKPASAPAGGGLGLSTRPTLVNMTHGCVDMSPPAAMAASQRDRKQPPEVDVNTPEAKPRQYPQRVDNP